MKSGFKDTSRGEGEKERITGYFSPKKRRAGRIRRKVAGRMQEGISFLSPFHAGKPRVGGGKTRRIKTVRALTHHGALLAFLSLREEFPTVRGSRMHDFSLDYGPYRGRKEEGKSPPLPPSRLVSLLLAWHAFSPLIAQQWYFHLSPPPLPPFSFAFTYTQRKRGAAQRCFHRGGIQLCFGKKC